MKTMFRRAANVALLWIAVPTFCLPAGLTLDTTVPPGANYDKAFYRLWYPPVEDAVSAVVVLMPGSNGDARLATDDAFWQEFATRNKVALLGCQLTDKPHDQNFIEAYAYAAQGSGQTLLDALQQLARDSKHPELAQAPLLLWGMSAGGEFNYEFVAWKPERVAAFVVNKGGIYYTALTSQATRSVPGILFVGGKDLEFRTNTISGLFAVNRRAGALWAFANEPGVAHVVGRSRDVAAIFFEDVLASRRGESSGAVKPISAETGFIGDLKTGTFQPAAGLKPPGAPTAWLPTERVARAWQAMVTDKPFEP
jgi:poly(3-hydroxybutyrate) depolymerase